jgi:hypothetical protein
MNGPIDMARKHTLSDLYSAQSPGSALESRVASREPLAHPTRPWSKTVALLAVLAGLSVVIVIAGRNVGAQSNHDLAGISRTFLVALANDNISGALAVCAESPEGKRILEAERRRVFGDLMNTDPIDPQARLVKSHTLNRLREELANQGVRWDSIKPLALGGVRARVLEPSLMKEPASLVWGHLYFSNAGRLYEIEVTAWQCGERFIIADVWDWAPLAVAPSEVEAFAKARSRRFLSEKGDAPDDTQIIRPRRIFISI